jgi:hypothetical protein
MGFPLRLVIDACESLMVRDKRRARHGRWNAYAVGAARNLTTASMPEIVAALDMRSNGTVCAALDRFTAEPKQAQTIWLRKVSHACEDRIESERRDAEADERLLAMLRACPRLPSSWFTERGYPYPYEWERLIDGAKQRGYDDGTTQ